MENDAIERADWSLRGAEFGRLSERIELGVRCVAMELVPMARVSNPAGWRKVCARWRALPAHPNVLEVVASEDERAWLRYAAIDWTATQATWAAAEIASCGVVLTRLFDLISKSVPAGERGWLTRPVPYVDLEHEVRIGFAVPGAANQDLPSDLVERWPECDERGLVFAVGGVLAALGPSGDPRLDRVTERCAEPDPRRRFASLRELRVALVFVGGIDGTPNPRPAWRQIEAGIGWLATGDVDAASDRFRGALAIDRCSKLARAGIERVAALRSTPEPPAPASTTRSPTSMPTPGLAAQVDAALGAKQAGEALAWADQLVAEAPDDGTAHYKRGRCLLVLGRLAEARDCFDRACTLSPQLIEAMLLRREADRGLGHVRATVGTQPAFALDVPGHLASVRDAVGRGRFDEALATLASPAHHDDAEAQLLRAALLAHAGRFADALAIYDRGDLFAAHRARVALGKARALVELDELEAALRLLDRACAEHPASVEAIDLRARVLGRLGRPDEAERELRRAANAFDARSVMTTTLDPPSS